MLQVLPWWLLSLTSWLDYSTWLIKFLSNKLLCAMSQIPSAEAHMLHSYPCPWSPHTLYTVHDTGPISIERAPSLHDNICFIKQTHTHKHLPDVFIPFLPPGCRRGQWRLVHLRSCHWGHTDEVERALSLWRYGHCVCVFVRMGGGQKYIMRNEIHHSWNSTLVTLVSLLWNNVSASGIMHRIDIMWCNHFHNICV